MYIYIYVYIYIYICIVMQQLVRNSFEQDLFLDDKPESTITLQKKEKVGKPEYLKNLQKMMSRKCWL